MDSYNEVRRVRAEMSKQAGHNIRTLIAAINQRWPEDAVRTINPGTMAEQCNTTESTLRAFSPIETVSPAREHT